MIYSLGKKALGYSVMVIALSCFSFVYAEQAVNDSADEKELGKIVVTAAGFAQRVREAPASISVITQTDLTRGSFRNVGEVLRHLEGVSIDQGVKSGGASISIRGLSSDYTLILIDGKRLNQNSSGARPNGFGDIDTNFIPPLSAIERIEVVRGPMSTLYGSDALGGVVNIITKKIPTKWGGEIVAYHTEPLNSVFASDSGINAYLAGPLQTDRLGLSFSAGFKHAENARGHYDEVLLGGASGKVANFSGLGRKQISHIDSKLTFTPNEAHEISADYSYGYQWYDNRDQQLGTLNSTIPPQKTGGGYADALEFFRSRFSLSHDGQYDFGRSETSLLFDNTRTEGRLNPVHVPPRPTDGLPRNIRYNTTVFDHKWVSGLKEHLVSLGGQYKYQTLKDTLAESPLDVSQWQWALFGEDEWQLTDDFKATLGLRFDRNEKFGNHFSPRLYLSWSINDMWQIRGGIGRAFRAPDIHLMTDAVIGLGGQGTIPLLGNANLKPETATSSELGLLFENPELAFNATIFYTDFKDKIESQKVPNCRASQTPPANCLDLGEWERNGRPVSDFYKRFNVNDARLYGLELGLNYALTDTVAVKANYTYTQSQRLDQVRQLPLNSTPRHMMNIKMDWDLNTAWTVWIQGEYRAKQFNDLNWQGDKVYYGSYGLMNIGANYQVQDDLELNAAIYNVLDKNFVDFGPKAVGTAPPAAADNFTNRYPSVLEGRRLWLSVKYNF